MLATCGRSVALSRYFCFLLHNITEMLLKVALNTINNTPSKGSFRYSLDSIYFNSFREDLIVTLILENLNTCTVDSRYLEFDGTMDKIRVNRSSTQEELRRYRKCGLFNNERETTRVKFWRGKTSIACPYSRNDFKHIRCFCCCFFSLR